jgi:hypothetical protein
MIGVNTKKSEPERQMTGESDRWEEVGYYGTYLLYGKENLRRIVEPETGKIVVQYEIRSPGPVKTTA